MRQVAQVPEQITVEAEVRTEHLRDAEGEVAVRDREENRLGQERTEELDLLLACLPKPLRRRQVA